MRQVYFEKMRDWFNNSASIDPSYRRSSSYVERLWKNYGHVAKNNNTLSEKGKRLLQDSAVYGPDFELYGYSNKY